MNKTRKNREFSLHKKFENEFQEKNNTHQEVETFLFNLYINAKMYNMNIITNSRIKNNKEMNMIKKIYDNYFEQDAIYKNIISTSNLPLVQKLKKVIDYHKKSSKTLRKMQHQFHKMENKI